jgi:fatty acid synthase
LNNFFCFQGDLSSFNWYESSPSIYTQKGKIPVTVYYTGLNFRDIMFATGRIQGDKFSNIGLEFSGIDQNGNRIMGFLDDGALATNLIVDDINSVWSIPDDWTLEEAATIPVVYATCYYALEIRAKLKPKEKVLIHSGLKISKAFPNLFCYYFTFF